MRMGAKLHHHLRLCVRLIMLRKKILVVLFSLVAGRVMAQEVKVTPLMSKVMTDVSGKEGLMITVEYPPGGSPISRQVKRHRRSCENFFLIPFFNPRGICDPGVTRPCFQSVGVGL
jgi:hypothetical protein